MDSGQDRNIAYAIANPGDQAISLKLALVDQNGTVVNNTSNLTLGPNQQIAEYLSQDLVPANFRGSLVIASQAGGNFIAVALLDAQGFLTAIQINPGKVPGVTY